MSAPHGTERAVTLWSLGPTVYLPTLIFAIGQGAFTPVVVLAAFELGASLETAGLLVAVAGIGLIVGDIPAGMLTHRIGERPAMIASSAIGSAGLLLCIFADSLVALGLGVLITGMSTAVWSVARQVYVTDVVPYALRARSLSLLAGLNRIGMFVGPLLGAGLITLLGVQGPFWLALALTVAAALILVVLPDIPSRVGHAPSGSHGNTIAVLRDAAPLLRTLGVAIVLVGIVRESRRALIPLWGAFIGLDAATISLMFGLSSGADMLLFYPAGKIMDTFGRWWAAIPSFVVLGIAHLLLPLATTELTMAAIVILMGVGNGMSSGIIMTLGADVAPAAGRAQFLGAWRMCHDIGRGIGPVVISAVIGAVSIAAAATSVGVAALIATAALHRWIPPRPPRAYGELGVPRAENP